MPSDSLTLFDPANSFPAELNENLSLAKQALKRQLPLIIICMVIGGVAALLFCVLQQRSYTATSSVQIEQQIDNVVSDNSKADPPPPSSDAVRQLNTQVGIIESRAMASRVAKDLGLVGKPKFYAAMGMDPEQWTVANFGSRQALLSATAGLLSADVTVSLPKDSRVATISFSSADPVLSARVANSYAYNLISLNIERRFRSSDYARNYLNEQVIDARSKLEASQRLLNSYARRAGIVNTNSPPGFKGGGSVTDASLLQLNEALNTARAKRIEAQQRLSAAGGSQLMSVPDVVGNPTVQHLLADLATQQEALSQARARYNDGSAPVLEAESKVRELQGQIQSAAGSVRSSLEADYRAAAGQEAALSREVAAAKGQSMAEEDRSVSYDTLSHDVDTNRALYDQLLERQREVSTTAGVTLNNISVLDEASPPPQPTWPKTKLFLVLGILLGMIIGAGIAIARELIDDRVDGTDELGRKLFLTSLGEIPLVRHLDPEAAVCSLDEPDSPLALGYAACRTALQFSTRDGLPKQLIFTSSDAGEGKTTSALGVARSLASAGKKVLLIEADFRSGRLGELLDLENGPGLSSILTEQASFEEAVQDSIYSNLDVIAAGPKPPNPADILDQERLGRLFAAAGRIYDCTVVDAPAVGKLADALLLAAATGHVVFVIGAGKSHRGRARAALRRLSATGAVVVGSVITKVPSAPFQVPGMRLLRRIRKSATPALQLPKAA